MLLWSVRQDHLSWLKHNTIFRGYPLTCVLWFVLTMFTSRKYLFSARVQHCLALFRSKPQSRLADYSSKSFLSSKFEVQSRFS